jgi:hypothetical protein
LGPQTSFFIPGFKVFSKENILFSYKKDFPEKSNKNYLDSLDFRDLLRQSKEIGYFYEEHSWLAHTQILYLIFSIILLLCLLLILNYFKNRREQLASYSKKIIDLSPEALSFLKKCLSLGINYTLTTHELTNLMGYSHQSYDTQRQYRSKLINQINDHFANNYNIPVVVVRLSSNYDRRFVEYVISPSHFEKICKIVN